MCRVQSKYIPMRCKTLIRKRPGWFRREIRNAMEEKQKAFIRFKIMGLEIDSVRYKLPCLCICPVPCGVCRAMMCCVPCGQ